MMGYAWYRTTFDGNMLRNEKDVYLNLGYIDDADEVFINGQQIGASGQFPPNFQTAYEARRIYYIPIEHLDVNGENTIAVRVYDTVHGRWHHIGKNWTLCSSGINQQCHDFGGVMEIQVW